MLAKAYDVESDARIKNITGRTSGESALAAVRKLQVTDYLYVDRGKNPGSTQRGFIAQEVEKVLPGAVTTGPGVVPDIFERAVATDFDANTGLLTVSFQKPHGLATNEVVKLMLPHQEAEFRITAKPSPTQFVVKAESQPEKVFVYGRVVKDFRSVDYDRIFTTGIAAIQELDRKVEAQAAALKDSEARVAELEKKVSQFSALESEMAALKKLVAGLASPALAKPVGGRTVAAR